MTLVLWLMGPTSAGKTTIAVALERRLRENHFVPVTHWDGDVVRNMLGPNLDFTAESRLQVVRTLLGLAEVTSRAGVFTIVSALTAHDDARHLIKETLPDAVIGFVSCPLETCIERDPKGLYQKAVDGEIDTLIGYNSPYNPPNNPDISVDTSKMALDSIVDQLADYCVWRA